MKMDKLECEYGEHKDTIMDMFNISKSSKKMIKKFKEGQKVRDKFG